MTSVIPTSLPAAEAAGESVPVADYGMLADCASAALVTRDGSIDWLCLPRYDSPAIFARLLDPDAGHWSIRPRGEFTVERRYLPGTLVIETTFTTDRQRAAAPMRWPSPRASAATTSGSALRTSCCAAWRASTATSPWSWSSRRDLSTGWSSRCFRQTEGGGRTFGGPNQVAVRAGVPVMVDGADMTAAFTVAAGEEAAFSLAGPPSRTRRRGCPPGWSAPGSPTPPRHGTPGSANTTSTKARTATRPLLLARAQGPDLPPDRRDRRRSDDVAAGDGRRRAQLGLPLLVDPRLEPHARGALHRHVPRRGRELRLVHDERRRRADRNSLQIMYGIGGEHDLSERELRTCAAGATRARCASATAPGTRSSSTSTASC